MLFERGKRRKNGFDSPYSWEQILTLFFYFLSTFTNYAIIISSCQEYLICVALNTIFFAIVLSNWYFVSSVNPEIQGNEDSHNHLSQWCWTVQRCNSFCIDCNKTIYKIDHHCNFLNTCIGEKNYLYFLFLLIFTDLQMFYHLSIIISFSMDNIKYMHLLRIFYKDSSLRYAIVVVQGLISSFFALYVLCLLVFHLYLICWKRKGTYDWILTARQKRLYSLQDEEPSSSLTESRIEHLRRQQERERFALQMEEARKARQKMASQSRELLLPPIESDDPLQAALDRNDSFPHISLLTDQVSASPIIPNSTIMMMMSPDNLNNNSDSNNNSNSNSNSHNEPKKTGNQFLGTFAFRNKGASIYPDDSNHLATDREETITMARQSSNNLDNELVEGKRKIKGGGDPSSIHDITSRTVDIMGNSNERELV